MTESTAGSLDVSAMTADETAEVLSGLDAAAAFLNEYASLDLASLAAHEAAYLRAKFESYQFFMLEIETAFETYKAAAR